jgi:thioesterase domain-containing protein
MLPAAFVVMDAFPLTSSGKVNRRALPAPDPTRPALQKSYAAPRDVLEQQLAGIWEEILGVRPIGRDDDFFELGGHSLLAVRMAAQVQEKLGGSLSLTTVFQHPTVEGIARALRNNSPAGDDPLACVVPFNATGARPPLFFVHPSAGSVHWYAELAQRLGKQQPFYGLQARGLTGDEETHSTVVDMAAYYVRGIRAVQREGPYHIGSWSMGVIIAFEVAQQLIRQDQQVALLALCDQGPIVPTGEPEDDAAYLAETFREHIPVTASQLRQLQPDEQIAHVFNEAKKVAWLLPDVTLSQFGHYVRMLRMHTDAWRAYQARPYPGRVTLFRAEERPSGDPPTADMGWARLALGGVDIIAVPGDHLSMMHEPHVAILAQKLAQCIERAAQAPAGRQ